MTFRTKVTALGAALRGDSQKRWAIAQRVARAIHPNAILTEHGKVWLDDEQFRADYHRWYPASHLAALDRVWTLDQLAQQVAVVPGDLVECGVHEGPTAQFLAAHADRHGRLLHLFDSWEGLSTPTVEDGDYWRSGDLAASFDATKRNLAAWDSPRFYKGWIPDRFGEVADRTFSLVHLDVDIYEPTRDSLDFFWPRLNPGGILVCDDYGFATCPGARRAVDEHMAHQPEPVIHLPTGQALVVKG